MTENIDKLWTEAVRQHIASLPPDEVAKLLADAAQAKEDKPDTTDSQKIRAAEKAGDWKTAFRLKSQQLGRLMNPPKE